MESLFNKIQKAHLACPKCPSRTIVHNFLEELLGFLFPEYAPQPFANADAVREKLDKLEKDLCYLLEMNPQLHNQDGKVLARAFFQELEETYDFIHQDVQAMLDGDPAARSKTEVVRSYPGFLAIAAYRLAHMLYGKNVQLIPRMMTEYAHSKTGVDIHPGAQIGVRFCIDHGTGVVIGETTIIGNDVKIYQGVTLGALSVEKSHADIKRHPSIEDGVVIYAGATILGGQTVIGAGSVVGGNVWLTKSIAPNSKIYYQSRMHDASSDTTDLLILKSGS